VDAIISHPGGLAIRPYTIADTVALRAIQAACFPPPFPSDQWWSAEQIAQHVRIFPAGALAAELDGRLVGSATALIVGEAALAGPHTWAGISANGWLTTHDPHGDTLYGVDIAVMPAARGRGVARALYQARFNLVRRLGLTRFLAASRISGYAREREKSPWLSAEAYADAVVSGRISDPVITPQLRAGLIPGVLLHEYIPDEESANCALLMEWRP
jgi:GNAT superfamily N-acetyltransferase